MAVNCGSLSIFAIVAQRAGSADRQQVLSLPIALFCFNFRSFKYSLEGSYRPGHPAIVCQNMHRLLNSDILAYGSSRKAQSCEIKYPKRILRMKSAKDCRGIKHVAMLVFEQM